MRFLAKFGADKILGSEMVEGGNRSAAKCLADVRNVLALDIFDNHDLDLVQEVDCEVTESVTQNRLLDEEHIAARLFDLLHNVEDVGTLFF